MPHANKVVRRFAPVALAATAVSLAAGPARVARADVKLVSKVTQLGGNTPQDAKDVVTTSYYKGKKFRSESPDAVILWDGDSGKMYSLNPARKTYTVVSMAGANPMMNLFDFKTDVTIKPGGKTKTVLGKPAKNYLYTVTINMAMKKGAMEQMMGAAPGVRSGASAPPPKAPPLPTVIVQGENWVTESVALPAGAGSGSFAALAQQVPGMRGALQKLANMKGLPLETRITTTVKGGPPNMPSRARSGNGFSTVATSLSEAPLPDSLFRVPADYKEAPRQARPGGMPGSPRPGAAARQ